MAAYKAPLRDMRYVLYDVFNATELSTFEAFSEFTPDLMDAVLEEASKVCHEVLQPLNRSGDEEGCTIENGEVRTPKGFKEAYATFCEGGWPSLSCDPQYGGQGAPKALNFLVEEMLSSSNLSFGLYPGLTHGAYVAISKFADDTLKDLYLPKMVEGTWMGTMCLTEPHSGTDLGLLRTRAVPKGDGSYAISGTKIFISAGDHDLAENIVHLVLARLPDAPKGIKGISLFLVPKFLPNENGEVGERNPVAASAIEHKMGIKASATCVMNFDDATGWLVGEPHKGMRAMFAMMNTERLGVGVQGLAQGEAAYQGAAAYARDRLQGRAPTGTRCLDKPADPLTVHPDVRRMLLTQRAYAEGCRALAVWAGISLDYEKAHPDPAEREAASELVALLTPIVKALLTDLGSESANIGMQVFGGHGYIREHGMEQYVRDCRITQLYEGTNGVQALDLVGRKLSENGGRNLRHFFHPVAAFIEANKGDVALEPFVGPLEKAFGRLQQATMTIAQRGLVNRAEACGAATEYLRLFGLTALGYLWARMAGISLPKMDTEEDSGAFHTAKVATALFYMERLLPQTGALLSAIMAGAATIENFPDLAFEDRD